METISVRERSSVPISEAAFRKFEKSAQFWELVTAGIFSLERTRKASFGLKAGAFVGQAFIEDILVRVVEKIEGSLAALLRVAEEPDVRLEDADSVAQKDEEVIDPLIDRFLDLLDRYLVRGRLKAYARFEDRSAMPRGKVSVPKTIRRWAVGRTDQVVYSYDQLTPKVFVNQLLGVAINVLGGVVNSEDLDRERRRRVRTAAILFEDTGWQSLLHRPVPAIQQLYEQTKQDWGVSGKLGELARLFALHFLGGVRPVGERTPASWFVNLETLFEECVRKAVGIAAVGRGVRVTDWKAGRYFVFPDARRYRTDPDIVLWQGDVPVAVLDAKYKDPEGLPGNPDIYQLLAHASAWGVEEAGLAYPADAFSEQPLGASSSNTTVQSFFIDVRQPVESAKALLDSFLKTGATVQV